MNVKDRNHVHVTLDKEPYQKVCCRSGSVKVDQLFAGDGSLWVLIDFMFAVTGLLCQMQVKRLELGANS